MDIDWDSLTLEELKDIQKRAEKAIAGFAERQRKSARAAAEAAAKEHGFSLKDLLGGEAPAKSKSAAKYRHPENPAKTWTGKGRQPNWIKEGIAAGKSLEDFAI